MSVRVRRIVAALICVVLSPTISGAGGPTDEERRRIEDAIGRNAQRLREEGVLRAPGGPSVLLGWPLRAANGLTDFGYHTTASFVDHNPLFPNQRLDFSCGERTYDATTGNHRGTDFLLTPFPWLKMANDQVEAVSAATGVIVLRQDGFYDQNCLGGFGVGNAIFVQHGDGSVAWYAHMKQGSLTPKGVGSSVAAGEYLGVVGSSGSSTGPHLHFELYDGFNQLQDPYAGPCNGLTPDSWWLSQRPYYDSAVNKLMTGSILPYETPFCPSVTNPNEQDSFEAGSRILFTTYYREIPPGSLGVSSIFRPDGSLETSWTPQVTLYKPSYRHTKEIEFSVLAPPGTWRFAVDFEGQLYEHFFTIGGYVGPGRVDGLMLGKPTFDGLPLSWSGSCNPAAASYAVFSGFIGSWYSHYTLSCDITDTSWTVDPLDVTGNRYYLVAPRSDEPIGSYGLDSGGAERPPSPSNCSLTQFAGCAGESGAPQ